MIKELEDYSWFPLSLRRYQADYIGSLVKWLSVYQPLVAQLDELSNSTKADTIQDLCSGSGIPAIYMLERAKNISQMLLSDKYPDGSFKDDQKLKYIKTSTDVIELVPQPGVCYTMYNAFHHFSPCEQKQLISKMAENKNGFLFAEILHPGILTIIRIVFAATVLQLLTAPFIKPFSFKRLFFTYFIPFNLLTVLYDGLISVTRSGAHNYYCSLFENMSGNDFIISVEQCRNWKGRLIFIKGNPVNT